MCVVPPTPKSAASRVVLLVSPLIDTTVGVPFVPNVAFWSSSWSVTLARVERSTFPPIGTTVSSEPVADDTTGASLVTLTDFFPEKLPWEAEPLCEMIWMLLFPSATGFVSVNVIVSTNLPWSTDSIVALSEFSVIDHPLSSPRFNVTWGAEFVSLSLYQKYEYPVSCGTVSTTFLAPATTLVLSLAASDGKIFDSPIETSKFAFSLSIPFVTLTTSTGFLGS